MNHNTDKIVLIFGVIIVFLLFSYMEFLHPYNFTKDDNLAQFLPVLIEGSQQLFSGHIPSINLHQLMGSPILEVGTYAVLYPPTVISYFLSHYVFHNDFLLIEIFVLIHLITGFIILYFLINSKIKDKVISLSASLAFVFSGYVIIMSAAWYYVIPTIVFLPLILFLNDHLNSNKKYIFILGISRGIYFYSGNAQYFVYTLIFEFIYMFLNLYQKDWVGSSEKIKRYAISVMITLIIALPLLLSQVTNIQDNTRGNLVFLEYLFSQSSSLKDVALGSIFLYPIVSTSHAFVSIPESFIDIYYSGTIFSLIFFLGGIYLITRYKKQALKKINPFFWMGVLSILLSLGVFGIIYSFGVFIPIINSFRHPIKFTLFVNFFTIVFGAYILKFFIEKIKKRSYHKSILSFIFIVFFILLIFHISLSTKITLTYYGDKLPLNISKFEKLDLENNRIISIYTNSTFNPKLARNSDYDNNFPEAPFLSENFATYFNLDHISGREPFKNRLTEEKIPIAESGLSNVTLNFTTLREYGVKYIFIPYDSLNSHPEITNLSLFYSDDVIYIYQLDWVKGYVFTEDGDLDYSRSDGGFDFTTNYSKEKNVTINLLYKDHYIAKIDGKKVKINSDALGRMLVNVPPGNHRIKVYYFPKEFVYGGIISLTLLILLLPFLPKLIETNFRIQLFLNWKFLAFLLLLILLMVVFMISHYLTDTFVIENLINQKLGVKQNISELKINPFSGKITMFNTSFLNENGEIASRAEKIILNLDYSKSASLSIQQKKMVFFFSELYFENISFFSESEQDGKEEECGNFIYREIDKKTNISGPFTLFTEKMNVREINAPSTSTFFMTLTPTSFIVEESQEIIKLQELTLQIVKESDKRYIKGVIFINQTGEDGTKTKSLCIFLPTEAKNQIYH